MSEPINNKPVFTLFDVANSIQRTLEARYQSAFWVKAEMNKLNYYKHSGHCYPELVEKQDGKIVAQCRSHIWKLDFFRINQQFKAILKEPLKDGIKVLLFVKITYTANYGLSLHILDIDPSYTLGDLERERSETIRRLQEENLFQKNKLLTLPLLPQRIALISVETSKGYADFVKVLQSAQGQYQFFYMLFPSLLQGDQAITDIQKQLNRIRKVLHHFDVVVIIRGGGGDVGLSCFNNYELAKAIAEYPIPVLSGIGHATNETVAELVSHYNAITPTKLAEFIIQCFHNFSIPVEVALQQITTYALSLFRTEKESLTRVSKTLQAITRHSLSNHSNTIHNLRTSIKQLGNTLLKQEKEKLNLSKIVLTRQIPEALASEARRLNEAKHGLVKDSLAVLLQHRYVFRQKQRELSSASRIKMNENKHLLTLFEQSIHNLDPKNILKRGYSITYKDGQIVRNARELKLGDELLTILADGKVKSKVE